MRKAITILGTILIAAMILTSGSAVATWYFADHVEDYERCHNPDDAVGAPDYEYATLGVETPILRLGWIILDLGSGNEMGLNQNFTVFASSTYPELYDVFVSENASWEYKEMFWVGQDYDTANHDFTTLSTPEKQWRYIGLEGKSGAVSPPQDPFYGPEIDAVGWNDE
jgi:hypothetical protein